MNDSAKDRILTMMEHVIEYDLLFYFPLIIVGLIVTVSLVCTTLGESYKTDFMTDCVKIHQPEECIKIYE